VPSSPPCAWLVTVFVHFHATMLEEEEEVVVVVGMVVAVTLIVVAVLALPALQSLRLPPPQAQ
jgi:hypothetical protein